VVVRFEAGEDVGLEGQRLVQPLIDDLVQIRGQMFCQVVGCRIV
jgi:hypothetical protein